MRIDSHQHYWQYHPVKDAWITDEMNIIKRDFSPADVWPLMRANGIEAAVAVQADQSENETQYLLDLADKFPFIKGIVGWVDLCDPHVEERLEYFSQFKLIKGFRHIVQAEKEDDFILSPNFVRGIGHLAKYNYTYDILIYPKHIRNALSFVKRFPNQKFIIDHYAKPFIKKKELEPWLSDLSAFSSYENVYCKMAGLVTEADWNNWTPEDFKPYTEAVLSIFGSKRLVFGTDWPVCLTGQSYDQVCSLTEYLLHALSTNEKEAIWGGNAKEFYQL